MRDAFSGQPPDVSAGSESLASARERARRRVPRSMHLESLGLATADDEAVWSCAVAAGLAILSKDEDFRHRSALRGPPPKVVRLRLGNWTTKRVEETLRMSASIIRSFLDEEESALLVLGHAAKP